MLYNESSHLLNHKNIVYILVVLHLQIKGILTAPLPEESSGFVRTRMPPLFIQNNCRWVIGAYMLKLVEVAGVMDHHSN